MTCTTKSYGARAASLCVALVVSSALLSGAAPSRDDEAMTAAKAAFQQGEEHYRLGRFAEALAAYSAAYEAKPLPGFLFNIGQCHRMLGDYERALFFYGAFLREKPDTNQRATVEAAMADATQKLEAKRAAEAEARAAEEKLKLEQAEAERARLELEAAEAARIAAEASAPRPLVAEPWFWLTASGAGVAVLALAGVGVTSAVLLSQPDVRVEQPSGTVGTLDRSGR